MPNPKLNPHANPHPNPNANPHPNPEHNPEPNPNLGELLCPMRLDIGDPVHIEAVQLVLQFAVFDRTGRVAIQHLTGLG